MKAIEAEDYRRIAQYVKGYSPEIPKYDFAAYDKRVYDFDECAAVPKERVRGKQFYTPKPTKDFEDKVKVWAKSHDDMLSVTYPIRVSIVIRDFTADLTLRMLGLAGIAYGDHGDLDNYAKAITDALNRIAYRDDKQIVKLDVSRRWSRRVGFHLTIERAGLNRSELSNLRKYIDA